MAITAKNRAVGLEIDTGMIRAVEVTGTVRNPRLLNMAAVSIAEGAVEEGMVVQPREVAAALRHLWSSGEIRHRQVLLGVSNQGVLVRYATIPKVPPAKLDNVIRFQAQEQMPIPLESVVLDYQVIGETTSEDGNTVLEVLLVAARRDMLNGFLEALDAAKLEAVDIDVSTLAMIHILPQQARDRTVAVVNVANGLSNILVADKNRARMARLVSVKLKDLADNMHCALDQVVDYSFSLSGPARDYYPQWINNLVTETRSSLTYFQDQAKSTELEAIILNGRGARLGGISESMEQALGLPVRVVNPFSAFSGGDRQITGRGIQAVEYALCAGLARRGLEGA